MVVLLSARGQFLEKYFKSASDLKHGKDQGCRGD